VSNVQAINRYKADLREIYFLLFEQFKITELLGKGPFEAWGEEEVRTSINEGTAGCARSRGRSTWSVTSRAASSRTAVW